MRSFFLTVLFSLTVFFLINSPATAGGSLIGTACSTQGETKFDANDKGLIACLCSTTPKCGTGDLRWKAMTGYNASCPNGAIGSIVNGVVTCKAITVGDPSCPTGYVMTGLTNGAAKCTPEASVPGRFCPATTTGGCDNQPMINVPAAKNGAPAVTYSWSCKTPPPFPQSWPPPTNCRQTFFCSGGAWHGNVECQEPQIKLPSTWTYPHPFHGGSCGCF